MQNNSSKIKDWDALAVFSSKNASSHYDAIRKGENVIKQTARIISTYAADVSGVCSALFELGGMTIMHDASGCNSTYNTHDEPRWYDMDSLVYISGLSEIEAIMGDDEKIVGDIVRAVQELQPNFVAIAGTPIPMMMGTDFNAIAALIEQQTNLPAFGFSTNGMHSYLVGASMAFEAIARRMTKSDLPKQKNAVTILGETPLDFSVNGSVESIRTWLSKNGFEVVGAWGMGGTMDEVEQAGTASVNLVVSYCGLAAAQELERKFKIPYVLGLPIGSYAPKLAVDLRHAQSSGQSQLNIARNGRDARIAIIGESVYASSLAAALSEKWAEPLRVICPLETDRALLSENDAVPTSEDGIAALLSDAEIIIADPLYQPICPNEAKFISLPHEAFSGRLFRKNIPNLLDISAFEVWQHLVSPKI